MTMYSTSRIVALLAGTVALACTVPAQAEWGGGYGGTPGAGSKPGGQASNWNQGGGYGGNQGRPGGWNQGSSNQGRPGGWGQSSGYGGNQGRPGSWGRNSGYGGNQGRPGSWGQSSGYGGNQGRPGGWGQNSGYGGMYGRPGNWGHGGGSVYQPTGYGGMITGKTCYNYFGKPYVYHGGGRCPIS